MTQRPTHPRRERGLDLLDLVFAAIAGAGESPALVLADQLRRARVATARALVDPADADAAAAAVELGLTRALVRQERGRG